jgi:glycosyltransferase involved in cell wall biosynthesis
MPGLFIERHARAVSAHAAVAVLYVHQDEKMWSQDMEVDKTRDKELLQIKIYYRPFRSAVPFLNSMFNLFLYLYYHHKGLKMITQEFGKPTLVHVNVLTRLGVIALLYKWISATPYIITEHWTRYLPQMDNFKGRLRKIATRLVVRKASAVMPVTENLRESMERHHLLNRNYRIIPNVVDIDMFVIRERPGHRDKKSFIHVSCFEDKQKNISGILRVLKRLSEKRTDWTCQMVGEGIHLEKLVAYAKELDLEGEYVFFHGLKENEELARHMAEADFQVLFSRFENLPVVILESYACGVPVLSTDVGGIKEHLHAGLGILIPSENENELFEQINYMLDNHAGYSKEKLRDYAFRHFSKEVIGKQLYEVYSAVVSNQEQDIPDNSQKQIST